MDYKIFNACTGVAHRGVWTQRESALKVGCGRKNLSSHRGIEPASAVCGSDALPSELHPHSECRNVPQPILLVRQKSDKLEGWGEMRGLAAAKYSKGTALSSLF